VTVALQAQPSDLDRFLDVIWQPGDVREIRIPGGPRGTDSGYFDDVDKLSAAVARYDGRENIYVTINPVAPALLARAANRILPKARTTTADVDVVSRRWLPIDLDPKRPTGISASEDEREHALGTTRAIYSYLHELGWPDPVTTMSGNGYWLLYPIELPNDDKAKTLVEGVLGHLAKKFGSPTVAIDTTVANAARIVALIGTMKVKGDPTAERPHRRSLLTYCPPELLPVPQQLLAELAPAPAITVGRPFVQVGRMPAGWVRKLLEDAGIPFREGQRSGRTWYRLQQCPFHPDDDQGGDCGVGEDADGKALGYCFHNRGAGKGWQDFKSALGLDTNVLPFPIAMRPDPEQPADKGMDAADLLALDLPPLRWIVPDLLPEGTTVLAAPPKVGKSCLVYQMAVEASIGGDLLGRRVSPGSVLYLALEDGKRRGQDRLRAVLAGRTMPRGRLEVRWAAPPIGMGLEEEIASWLDGHPDAVMVAVDTLGKVRPPGGPRQRNAYEVDVEHLNRLQALFRDLPVALVIVHHSAKEKRDDFLASVSGTYGITGSADTIVVVQRKRSEAFGQIHVTGRDAPDATLPVRFDGLLWQGAPGWAPEATFEQSETYRVIEQAGKPIFAKAVADALGITREAAQMRIKKLEAGGSVMRVEGGYAVAGVRLNFVKPDSVPTYSSSSESKGSNEGHTRADARTAAGEWLEPCRDYDNHRNGHRRVGAGWKCDICSPEVH
jgi:biotin operon repressor